MLKRTLIKGHALINMEILTVPIFYFLVLAFIENTFVDKKIS